MTLQRAQIPARWVAIALQLPKFGYPVFDVRFFMETTRIIGNAVGIQYQGVTDRSGSAPAGRLVLASGLML